MNNFQSKQEIALVELSAGDVEILDEGSLSGEAIKIDEDYKIGKVKSASGGRNWPETLSRPNSLMSPSKSVRPHVRKGFGASSNSGRPNPRPKKQKN